MQTAAFVGAQDEYLSTHARALVSSHTQPNGVKEHSRERDWREVDLGPLVGRKRGLNTREHIPFSGGMEMEVEPAAGEAERRGARGVLMDI